jgi:diguanylate cyclase (GGDEF)-like protein
MDLNNLKQVNDQFGHIDGDDLLKESAKILRKIKNKNHRVYRIGGDEFCIIILNESEEQVEDLLAELELERQTMNKTREVPISFALGYSAYQPDTDIDLSEAKARADKMMYQIKDIMKRK